MTETLAELYIEQKKFKEALKAYELVKKRLEQGMLSGSTTAFDEFSEFIEALG